MQQDSANVTTIKMKDMIKRKDGIREDFVLSCVWYRYMIYIKCKDYEKLVKIKNMVELYMNDNVNYFKKTGVQFDFNPIN